MDTTQADVALIAKIRAVPTILDVICRSTGMGFAAVARVTDARWVACSVKDDINFGLKPASELKLESTICHEIRQSREAVIIDHVAEDAVYRDHHTPATYGFQSYISMPIILSGNRFFGTLCAIDPNPAKLKTPEVIGMFKLFAELIGFHIDAQEQVTASELRLSEQIHTAELREQFIAVLGHDLRNPLGAISTGAQLLERLEPNDRAKSVIGLIRESASRMLGLIESVLDLRAAEWAEALRSTATQASRSGLCSNR